MTKEEFLALAEQQWEQFSELKKEEDFYTYEKEFDRLWVEYGRQALERSISEVPSDRRKKKTLKPGLAKCR